jgi:hypothetical protein
MDKGPALVTAGLVESVEDVETRDYDDRARGVRIAKLGSQSVALRITFGSG